MVVVMSLSSQRYPTILKNFSFHAVKSANRSVRRMVVAFHSVPGSEKKILGGAGGPGGATQHPRFFETIYRPLEGFAHEHR
jgi:hypothetical protein